MNPKSPSLASGKKRHSRRSTETKLSPVAKKVCIEKTRNNMGTPQKNENNAIVGAIEKLELSLNSKIDNLEKSLMAKLKDTITGEIASLKMHFYQEIFDIAQRLKALEEGPSNVEIEEIGRRVKQLEAQPKPTYADAVQHPPDRSRNVFKLCLKWAEGEGYQSDIGNKAQNWSGWKARWHYSFVRKPRANW